MTHVTCTLQLDHTFNTKHLQNWMKLLLFLGGFLTNIVLLMQKHFKIRKENEQKTPVPVNQSSSFETKTTRLLTPIPRTHETNKTHYLKVNAYDWHDCCHESSLFMSVFTESHLVHYVTLMKGGTVSHVWSENLTLRQNNQKHHIIFNLKKLWSFVVKSTLNSQTRLVLTIAG